MSIGKFLDGLLLVDNLSNMKNPRAKFAKLNPKATFKDFLHDCNFIEYMQKLGLYKMTKEEKKIIKLINSYRYVTRPQILKRIIGSKKKSRKQYNVCKTKVYRTFKKLNKKHKICKIVFNPGAKPINIGGMQVNASRKFQEISFLKKNKEGLYYISSFGKRVMKYHKLAYNAGKVNLRKKVNTNLKEKFSYNAYFRAVIDDSLNPPRD